MLSQTRSLKSALHSPPGQGAFAVRIHPCAVGGIVLHLFIVTSLKYAEIHLAEVVYGDILGSRK